MPPIKTFVSFSTKDHLFVRHLLARLHVLNLRPWDYSLEGSELPFGRPINPSLEERINESGRFIVIVSNSSTAAPYCQFEVARAVELYKQKPIQIAPLVDGNWCDPGKRWPGTFAGLRQLNLRYSKIDIDRPLDAEAALQHICQEANERYQPPAEDTPHFPFMTRLYRELLEAAPGRIEKGNSIYRRLFDAQVEFNAAVKREDYEEAFRKIKFIDVTLQQEFPNVRFYYPIIAKGVCQTQLKKLSEALETFGSLENHPLRDSNWSGAMGYVYGCQGRYEEAAKAYSEVWLKNRTDIAALHGAAINALFAGIKISYDDLCASIACCKSDDPDRQKISEMKGLALLMEGRHSEAADFFGEIACDSKSQLGPIIQWSEAFVRSNRASEALAMLELFYVRFGDSVSFLEQIARIHRILHNPNQYIGIMDQLAVLEPNECKHVMRKALALSKLGRLDETRDLSRSVTLVKSPSTESDWYYQGMAYYLLGNASLAQHYFEKSQRGQDWQYSKLVPNYN